MKISVVTTCFNAAGTLLDCLESVKKQTHPDVEHVVVDAASTDGTLDILAEHGKHLARVVSEPDMGIYDGMNKGLRLATGDVVGILNADDFYFCPDVLAKVAGVFEDESVDSCYGDLVYVAQGKIRCQSSPGYRRELSVGSRQLAGHGCAVSCQSSVGSWLSAEMKDGRQGGDFRVVRYWRSGEFAPRKFYWGWMVPHPTFFVRRSVYEKYGGFNLDLGTAADYELMLRFLVKYRISSAYLPEILIAMRAGGASNATLARRIRANAMDRRAWEVNGLKPLPWTLLLKPLRKLGQWVARPKI